MVIVSMTSFPARLALVPLAYKHFITTQTRKCDKYVLWLSRAEFGGEKTAQEIGLEELVDIGVEIHWCDEDGKIHIRHNSLKLWPEETNLIIDEDLYYPPTYTQELLEAAEKYPDCIISYFACFEIFTGYKKFELPRFRKPNIRNKFNGGLSCFPPHTFPQICFKYQEIRDKACPYHDETWVNLFSKFNGVKVYGLHRINWKSIEHIKEAKSVVHLHDVHSNSKSKYRFDVTQFNQVLYIFPELKSMYKQLVFGVYNFRDKKELDKYKNTFEQVFRINK